MAKGRHRGAFVFGSILGGAVGAVAALWKTPQSGAELRRKLGFESEVAHSVTAAAKHASASAGDVAHTAKPLPARALGFVEQVAAPLVGVKLGHTANNSQPGAPGGNSVEPDPGVVRRKTELVDINAGGAQ
ncbi:MAG: hypothetical protein M3457_00605 [Chloroflexota bacterium]|nr:hypothetical protein [Chloroflexota bacterium]